MSGIRFTKLLAVTVILGLLVYPALSAYTEKDCISTSEGCTSSKVMSCCDSSGSCLGDACFSQSSLPFGKVEYDPYYSYLGAGSSLSSSKGLSRIESMSYDGGSCSDLSSIDLANIGPPYPEVVKGLPPSAKLVYTTLQSEGLLTQKDLIAKTYLPGRTVRYALGRLKNVNMIQERFCFKDARQSLYGLNPAALE